MPFLFLLYVVAYIDRTNISFAGLRMTQELGFSDAVFGFGSGVFFFGYTLLAIPGAMLVERWSARKTMAATMIAWGLVASATGFIATRHEFYSMRFLLGIAEAAFFPGVITYLSHWYRQGDRAKAVALFMAAIPVSRVIAAPISAALIDANWLGLSGWRWLLIVEGGPALVLGIVSLVYLTDRPRDARWLSSEQRDWLTRELQREATDKQAARMPLSAVFRHRDVWFLCLAYFGGTTGEYGLSLWLPKILQRVGGLTAATTALLTAIPSMIAVPAMLIVGWRSDHLGERRWHAAVPRMIAGIALTFFAIRSLNVAIALALFSVATAGITAGYGPLWAIPSTILGSSAAAASIGLINAAGNIGGFAGPSVIGWFSTRTGEYAGGLWSVAAALIGSGIFALLVKIPIKR
ncbi:MAG: MFS transporter [Bryobacterales bacterium]|nr:MFS transporter [Bryobacterales bacterium]MBV9402086.1 MFS transporter [Bryobacterales bacterium]